MPVTRTLLVLNGLRDADAALAVVRGALLAAGSPGGLCFALPKRLEKPFGALCAPSALLSAQAFRFYGERGGLASVRELIADETHFLFLMGEYAFSDKWDQTLLHRFSKLPEKNAVLTGSIGEAGGETPVQAYLPALAETFEGDGVLIQRGLPLVTSAAPVRTLVIDPALLFGRVSFLREAELRLETLSIAAYVAGIPVYALDRAPLWPVARLARRWLRRPVRDVLPGTTLARFEQLAGLRYEQKRACVRANWGLFFTANSYAQQMPQKLLASQRVKALFTRPKPSRQPLLATAFIDLPNPRKPLAVYLLRFEFLKAIQSLPLYLYTGGSQERALRAGFANAHSYPDNALLPRTLLQKGMTEEQLMRRGKLLLLQRTALRHPDFTHVAWVNIDTLKHPVCPQAVPDFSPLMDDRVHLATVNAIPDASFLIVPVRCLTALCREVLSLTQLDVEMKRSLTEVALIERLYQRRPDLFALHPMPKKHLLFLTAFDPSLLDARSRALLQAKETR